MPGDRSKRTKRSSLELPSARPASLRYGITVGAVAISTLISIWLRPFSQTTPFLFFYPAVIFSAWTGGLRPGLLATGLCSLAANYFLLEPYDKFSFDTPNLIRTLLFAAGFSGICWLVALARKQLRSVIRVQSQLLDLTFDPIIVRDAKDRVIYWNEGAERLYGWTADEAYGQVEHALLKTQFPKPLEAIVFDLMRTGRWHGELTHTKKDGSTVIVASSWTIQAEGQSTVLEASYDLSERKQAERALRESEERLRTVFNSVYDGILLHTPTGSIIDLNDRFLTMYGITHEEAPKLSIADISSPTSPIDALPSLWAKVMAGQSQIFEWKALRPHDRSEFDVEVFLSRVLLHGERDAVLANVRDITDRKRVESQIQELNEALKQRNAELDAERTRWQGVVKGIADEVWVCDSVGKMSLVNLHTVTPMCLEAFAAKSVEAVLEEVEILYPDGRPRPPDQAPLLRSLRGEILRGEEIMRHRRTGKTCHRHFSSAPVRDAAGAITGAVAIVRDITDQKKVEDERRVLQMQLAQAQKMEAIGRMAGGVAHDFNNLLNVISGYSEIALRSDPIQALKSVGQIQKATGTAAALTRQLLTLSSTNVLEPRTIDFCEVIRETGSMLPRLLGEDIQVQTHTCSACASRMTPGQLEQIIINLAVNARDAMPHGGTLTFRTSATHIDEARSKVLGWLPPGSYVMLSVSDTGEGITEDLLPRVFEPFFTTKEPGKGTGLGLSTVRGIVNQNGGRVFVESVVGAGTTFTIYLPRVEASGEAIASAPTDTAVRTDLPRGSETILLVEDSVALCEMTRVFLEMQGYTVHAAPNGVEALVILQKVGPQIDLLFTDVVMPLMSGPELAQKVKQFQPHLKVLYASGYAGDLLEQHGVARENTQVIEKPYSFETLSLRVRESLGPLRELDRSA